MRSTSQVGAPLVVLLGPNRLRNKGVPAVGGDHDLGALVTAAPPLG